MSDKKYDIETRLSYITKIESDVVRVEIKKDTDAELEDLEENYRAYQSLFADKKLYFLVVFNKGSNTTLEVRNKFASERSSFKIAEAIVVRSIPHKLIANFVLKVQKPKHKMQVFNNEEDALGWLMNERSKKH